MEVILESRRQEISNSLKIGSQRNPLVGLNVERVQTERGEARATRHVHSARTFKGRQEHAVVALAGATGRRSCWI